MGQSHVVVLLVLVVFVFVFFFFVGLVSLVYALLVLFLFGLLVRSSCSVFFSFSRFVLYFSGCLLIFYFYFLFI